MDNLTLFVFLCGWLFLFAVGFMYWALLGWNPGELP